MGVFRGSAVSAGCKAKRFQSGGASTKMWLPLLLIVLALQIPGTLGIKGEKPKFENVDEITQKLSRVTENQKLGEVIVTVKATEGNLPITYSINLLSFFKIDEKTGEIRMKTRWDFETHSRVKNMDITAEDSEGDRNTMSVTIELVNVNDNPPKFSDTREGIEANETDPVDKVLYGFFVTDVDRSVNDIITVTCINGQINPSDDTCDFFKLQPLEQSNKEWYGQILLGKALDYETTQSFAIRLRAFDGVNNQDQEIQVEVLDINDSPPLFVRAISQILDEEKPVGSNIDYVSAVDSDQTPGIARPIRYELMGDTVALNYFEVSKIGGNITNKVVLDYDNPATPKEFLLQFKARELLATNPEQLGNDSTTTAITSLTITMVDLNDNCPKFDKRVQTFSMPESIANGNNLNHQLRLIDRDYSDEFRKFDLTLVDPTGTFELVNILDKTTPASIYIRVVDSSKIDFEGPTKSYQLVVTARDQGNPACSDSTMVRIEVTDVNDEIPVFTQKAYNSSVMEDAGEGTVIIKIQATDRDSGTFGTNGIRYSFVDDRQKLFQIDPISGVVTVAKCDTPGTKWCIDYEWEKSYRLSVKATDTEGSPSGRSQIVELFIQILNLNDNAPIFIGNYTRYIREGFATVVGGLTVTAIDKDGDQITYTLIDSPDAQLWRVNSGTGEVTAIRPVNRDDVRDGTFNFDALASDGSRQTTAGIEIIVIDVNDNTPEFVKFMDYVTIRENYPPNKLVKVVSVTDKDSPTSGNGQVDVSIDSGSFGKFRVNNVTYQDPYFVAEIYTEADATFDFDLVKNYTLIMKARDKGTPSNTGTGTLIVYIEDINNKDPYFDPPTISASVREDAPILTSVVTVSAQDQDVDKSLEISFGSPIVARNPSGMVVTDQAKYVNMFKMSKDGLVRTNQPLDRDTVSNLEIPLIVKDVKANPVQTGRGSLFIRVLEYNDQAPQFEFPFYNLTVEEERTRGAFVASLLAFDEDDEINSYRLISNPERLFSIATQTGVLTVNGRLDYETRHNVTLVARATDNGRPELSNTTVIFVRIININDNPPVFSQNIYEINLPEHSKRRDAVGVVHATDRDEEDFGVVRYKADDLYFTVDNITGQIFLKPGANLDRESFTTHTFEVTAYDSPNNPSVRRQTTTQVYVILGDINDNCPTFRDGNSFSDTVIETADVGDQVLEMYASDKDYKENRSIEFRIDEDSAVPPSTKDLFSIESVKAITANIESGRIEVKNRLRGKAGIYRFTVIASDQNGKNLTGDMCSTRVNVTIKVQAAINNPPRWILPPNRNFTIDVLESQYRGMLVYDCKAEDDNRGKEGIVDYYFNFERVLQSTTPEFRINRVTGVISARVVFDREQVASYVLSVVAKDQGNPSSSSETVLVVNVLDVNDNEPEFPMRNGQTIPYEESIPEGKSPAEVKVILTVSATDRDSDHKNNKVYYKIVAGNDDNLFELGRESGDLRLNPRLIEGLDREAKAVYRMEVLAYNDVNDDSVIRYRRKRSTNPSIAVVVVTVEDANDTPPKFLKSDYHGCVPRDAAYGQSIVKVEAVDQDEKRARFMTYTKIQETTDGYFTIDSRLGIVRNAKLLNSINHNVATLRIRVNDNANQNNEPDNTVETNVKVFVTDKSNEVKLVIGQPSADVRYYRDQIIRAMINTSSPTPISYICIREIRDRLDDAGVFSSLSSDVFLSAVYQEGSTYKIYNSDRLRRILYGDLYKYQSLHVQSVEAVESEDDELSLTEDPVLAIFIIAILLIFLAIILFILACCLIRNSKKKKIKKLRAAETRPVAVVMQQPAPEVGTNVNPVYDNKGFDDGNEYAVVHKKRPAPEPVGPPIIPVVVPALEPEPEPTPAIPVEEPEPVIITELFMSEEEPVMQPPPENFFTPEPVVTVASPLEPEPEPMIETVVISDDDDDYHIPEPPMPLPEDEIDVEFRDIDDSQSPRRSPSPPSPPDEEEYRIETNVL